jgi:hypothetical protein
MILTTTIGLTSCQRSVETCDCKYTPWPIEEYELFGLTKEQILSKWNVDLSRDGTLSLGYQRFNLEFSDALKVRAVQRYFVGCQRTYYGRWLESKSEALDYCIKGLADYDDSDSKAKLIAAKQTLADLSAANKLQTSTEP